MSNKRNGIQFTIPDATDGQTPRLNFGGEVKANLYFSRKRGKWVKAKDGKTRAALYTPAKAKETTASFLNRLPDLVLLFRAVFRDGTVVRVDAPPGKEKVFVINTLVLNIPTVPECPDGYFIVGDTLTTPIG